MGIGFRRGLSAWRRDRLDLIFPPRCACCDTDLTPVGNDDADLGLCATCRNKLGPEPRSRCGRCGAAADNPPAIGQECPRCRGRRLHFERVLPLGGYEEQAREVVLRMKRRSGDFLSDVMGRLYAVKLGKLLSEWEPDLLVAVPMHWIRRLLRGTNSPEIVTRRIGKELAVPMAPGLLRRSRNTLPQADLPPGRRFHNVRGAFGLRAGYDLRGMRVAVVDDIMTTGATCSEVAKVLKRAGAATVIAAVLARAEGPQGR